MWFPSLLLAAAAAQDPSPSAHVPTVTVAPTIDGVLQEEAWGAATRLTDFTQVRPVEGAVADPPTEVWLMRDQDHLYLAFVCHEPTPQEMVLQNIKRDAFLNDDDRIEFVLDTFHDSMSGYFFQISAAGSRGDALLGANGRRFNKPWDGFWKGEARVLPDRWVAEIAIPFATMAFGDGDTWQVNFERFRGADRSSYRWSSPRRELFLGMVSEGGDLHGFSGIRQAQGFEFRPFLKGRREHPAGGPSSLTGDLGGELSWSVTPQLKAAVTWNTDFAETEVDQRQVNLSRYPLFFPEKRDFFLQDTTLFQFGEQSGRGRGGNQLQPFFSRRIGLVDGVEVPIQAGLRLAGRADRWDLGFLGVRTEASGEAGTPDSDLFVLRPSYNLSEGLAVGALLTSGDPSSSLSNQVLGLDLRWATASWLPGNFSLNTFLSHSDDEPSLSRGLGFGSQVALTTKDWSYNLSFLGSQSDYRPALGFVRRPGEFQTSADIEWEPKPKSGPVREYEFSIRPMWWNELDGRPVSTFIRFGLFGVEFDSGDRFNVGAHIHSDRPTTDFEMVDGLTMPAGDYRWSDVRVSFDSSDARALALGGSCSFGGWYDGRLMRSNLDLIWRPDGHLKLAASYREERARLPIGDFVVRIERLSCDYAFSTNLTLETLLQADNQSDSLGLQSRLRWLLEDGRELFLVLDAGVEEQASGAIVPTGNELTAKLVYAVRF